MAKRKRGQNEGSIYLRKDWRWAASISLPEGKRRTFYGRTAEEARGKLLANRQSVADGLPLPSEQMTVARFAQDWLVGIRPNVRPATWQHYESLLRVHALPTLGRIRLSRLQPSHLQKLYNHRLESGSSPTTVRHVHKVIHLMLEKAVRWGAVVRNVAGLCDPPRPLQRDLPMITAEQAGRLLTAAEGHRLEALFVLALTTGARMSELIGLSWPAIDLERGSITIRATLQLINGEFQLVETKTTGSRRTVALAPMAVSALRRHYTRQMEEKLRVGPAWDNALGLCFTTKLGEPLKRHRVLRQEYRPLARAAEFPASLTFHDLRHIAASLALSQNVPWTLVSEMLGHANVSTTMNVYAHTVPGTQGQIADAMEAVFNRAEIV